MPELLNSSTPIASTSVDATPAKPTVQSVLEKLFELHPHLFGAQFLPLKLGSFQELMARHPDRFDRGSLKAALGVHTRSTRYLQSVAQGLPRHDLDGAVVEPVAVEHVCLSILELFRRRQGRTRENLQPKVTAQLLQALEASDLSRQDVLATVLSADPVAQGMLGAALDQRDALRAKREALSRAFVASGKSLGEFADMYGLGPRDLGALSAATAASPPNGTHSAI